MSDIDRYLVTLVGYLFSLRQQHADISVSQNSGRSHWNPYDRGNRFSNQPIARHAAVRRLGCWEFDALRPLRTEAASGLALIKIYALATSGVLFFAPAGVNASLMFHRPSVSMTSNGLERSLAECLQFLTAAGS